LTEPLGHFLLGVIHLRFRVGCWLLIRFNFVLRGRLRVEAGHVRFRSGRALRGQVILRRLLLVGLLAP